jgi:uncharacterized protein (UPF0332 family)
VTVPWQDELERARRELQAARALIDAGFPEKTVSSGYYAVFHAAEAALLVLGQARSKHSGVISAFGQLVVHEGGFDRELGRVLRQLFERRNDVDYGLEYPTGGEASRVLDRAERFVDEVERWIESRAAASE